MRRFLFQGLQKYKNIALICLLNSSFLVSQKSIQMGIGAYTGSLNLVDKGNSEFLKMPYGISLHIDYLFAKSYKLKSGVEIIRQRIKIPFLHNVESKRISIPIIFSKSLTNSQNKKWNLGIECGISWIFNAKLNEVFFDNSGLYFGKVKSQRTVNNFQRPNITGRVGLNIFKPLRNNSTLQFFLRYDRSLYNWDKIYFESQSPIEINGNLYGKHVVRNIIDLSQNTLQFGFYLSFDVLKQTKE